MPEISRFYGIVIRLFFDDHNPPHFHAGYGEHQASVEIRTLAVFDGWLPPRALGLTLEWAATHRHELLACWERASDGQPPGKIDPLA